MTVRIFSYYNMVGSGVWRDTPCHCHRRQQELTQRLRVCNVCRCRIIAIVKWLCRCTIEIIIIFGHAHDRNELRKIFWTETCNWTNLWKYLWNLILPGDEHGNGIFVSLCERDWNLDLQRRGERSSCELWKLFGESSKMDFYVWNYSSYWWQKFDG